MKICFAGSEPDYYSIPLKLAGVKNSLQSAYYLNYTKQPNKQSFDFFLLDSGGFTLRKNKESCSVEDYAKFIKDFGVKIAFNLDTVNVEETLSNQEYLEKHSGAYIIPIYHYSDFKDLRYREMIIDFVKRYPFISTAAVMAKGEKAKKEFFNYVFSYTLDKVKVHGLAATDDFTMGTYPLYSVDSTSWLSAERYGISAKFNRGKMSVVLGVKALSGQKEPKISHRSFLDNKERLKVSIASFLKSEKYYTDLWQSRGVVWHD